MATIAAGGDGRRHAAPCCPPLPGSELPGPLSVFIEVPAVPTAAEENNRAGIFLMSRDCKDGDGQPWVPPVVKKTCLHIANDPTLNHEYLPALGLQAFTRAAMELAIGKENTAVLENRVAGVQTLGSTGALRIGAEFLCRWYKTTYQYQMPVYISELTWGSHCFVFEDAGFTDIRSYRYWDSEKRNINFQGMMDDLENAPDSAIVVLDCSSYNPTGIGLAYSEWERIADMTVRKMMFPIFYLPAQGLVSGNLETDSEPVRFFAEKGLELFCAQSFSKNFGLYGERVGNLIIVMKQNKVLVRSRSQLEKLATAMWGSPPVLGARIVTTILNNSTLYAEWKRDLRMMVERTSLIREKMKDRLRNLGTPLSWDHITEQAGIFSFTGLTPLQVEVLSKQKNIHLDENGQINVTCLNSSNLDYVTQSIWEAVTASNLKHSQ